VCEHAGLSPDSSTIYALHGGDVVPALQIRWKSPDLSLFAAAANPLTTLPTSQPSSTTSTGDSTASGLKPPAQPFPTRSDVPGLPTGQLSIAESSSSAGLSPGEIAGIAIGVTACFLVTAATFLLIRRRSRRRLLQSSSTAGNEVEPELDGNPKSAGLTAAGLPASREHCECELPVQTVQLAARELSDELVLELSVEFLTGNVFPAARPVNSEEDPPPVVATRFESSEVAERELADRQAQLRERRRRLLELEQIDQEEESIRQRLAQLRRRPPERHEVP
jgi:hypothetical protein